MKKKTGITGSEIICRTLESLGIEVIFGLPGTQNIHFYRSLHHSSIRAITTTSELAASFMANGYYRSSGKIAAINTISGPGFTYALSGIAEAFLDSVPMLCIVGSPQIIPGKKFAHQAIDQQTIIKPIVKDIFKIANITEIQETLNKAYLSSLNEEPGPVYIEVDDSVYSGSGVFDQTLIKQYSFFKTDSYRELTEKAIAEILKSQRILFYLGQGANQAHAEIRDIVELFNSPVLTTSSGRGILPENHPLLFPFNVVIRGGGKTMKEMIKSSDLIVALGCKFSFNGSGAFQFEFPEKKLIHVDLSSSVLNANYPAKIAIQDDVNDFISELHNKSKNIKNKVTGWPDGELAEWRKKAVDEINGHTEAESYFEGGFAHNPASFFEKLQKHLPENSIIVTDSGQHQMLTRKYYKVPNVRGLIIPSNFQSMGFSIPAAIGAKLAVPDSTVVVIIGDGGFNISATELLTALREKITIKVIILNDKSLGLIRTNQINKFGFDYSTNLLNPDYAKLAESFNIEFVGLSAKKEDHFELNLKSSGITLIEVSLRDSMVFYKKRSKRVIRRLARKIIDKLIQTPP
ncbi:MAG TPA: thiamine pyrophosphate-binding protein [Bacteroidetes bacterium]|nr:thiamine pyrophosphate-binding protein [Bacteroidota bacterium]